MFLYPHLISSLHTRVHYASVICFTTPQGVACVKCTPFQGSVATLTWAMPYDYDLTIAIFRAYNLMSNIHEQCSVNRSIFQTSDTSFKFIGACFKISDHASNFGCIFKPSDACFKISDPVSKFQMPVSKLQMHFKITVPVSKLQMPVPSYRCCFKITDACFKITDACFKIQMHVSKFCDMLRNYFGMLRNYFGMLQNTLLCFKITDMARNYCDMPQNYDMPQITLTCLKVL